jgi:2'-hydroxyisoflavone reductase
VDEDRSVTGVNVNRGDALVGSTRLDVLILGGTGFLGPATIDAALARGHRVTIFNRGRRERRRQKLAGEIAFRGNVETLHGNRDPDKRADDADPASPKGLTSLEGRAFDAVIDISGYYPRHVKASADLLARNCGQYIFVSSVSRYAKTSGGSNDETAPAATITDPSNEEMGSQFQNYGPLKALCEEAVERAFPRHATTVRPGYIVGPGDLSPQFTYWVVRTACAVGHRREVLVTGTPDDPVQIIDVRDLGAWLITVVENKTVGAFNACGPAEKLTVGALMRTCANAAGTDPVFTNVPAAFCEQRQFLLPMLPARHGEGPVFHEWCNTRARAAGLTFRSVAQTCTDTLTWFNHSPEDRRRSLGKRFPSLEREAEVLRTWHAAEVRRE